MMNQVRFYGNFTFFTSVTPPAYHTLCVTSFPNEPTVKTKSTEHSMSVTEAMGWVTILLFTNLTMDNKSKNGSLLAPLK